MSCRLSLPSASEAQTGRIAAALAKQCVAGDCITLAGDLGSGKTAFARGFIRAWAGQGEEVTSPTFTIMQDYQCGDLRISHFDLYRLKSAAELEQIGLDDALAAGITLIEWPEVAAEKLPVAALAVRLEITDNGTRAITITGDAPWEQRLKGLL